MTGAIRIEKQGRVWLEQRYSFRDDRDRILQRVWEEYEPPYEIIIVPDTGHAYAEPKLSKSPAPSHQQVS